MATQRKTESVETLDISQLVKGIAKTQTRALHSRLSAQGIPTGHWEYLLALWERDGITQRDLSVITGFTEPTTSTAIKSMLASGYIHLAKRPDNNKNNYVFLTPAGKKLKQRLMPLQKSIYKAALRDLSADELALTEKVLSKVASNLSRILG